jgi:CubicO group peptidase (beta-lactamase class C family)
LDDNTTGETTLPIHKFIALLLVLCLSLPAAAFAQDGETYADPGGRFTVPIPTNWTAETLDGYTVLRDPDELISAYILVVEGDSAEAAIPLAWAVVDPDFDLTATDSFAPPPPPGEDELFVINYEMVGDRFLQAVGRRVGETVYVLLFDGDITALSQRNAQAQQIASGLMFTSVAATDLSEAEPLPVADVIDDLESYAADLLMRLEVPGAAIAIVQDGEIVYTGAFGVKTLGEEDPVTVDTQFLIGSTTKPMTTTMMAALVDGGQMTWDEPVTDLLPNFAVADPDLTERFTVRNLVCACTGVPRRDFELIFNGNELGPDDIIASLAEYEFFTDFGEAFQYSNQLVATGGFAAAAAYEGDVGLGVAYRDAMQDLIFDPIGMSETTFDFASVTERGDYAIPHGAFLDGTYQPLTLSLEEALLLPIEPAGGAWSTVGDMSRFMLTMLDGGVAPDGTRIVSDENLDILFTPQVAISADSQYGLGWFVSEYNGVRLIGHDGNTLGMTSVFSFLPDVGVGIVVLSNGQGANLYNQGVAARLLELIYEQPFANEEQIQFMLDQAVATEAELAASIGDAPAEANVAAYLGEYTNDALGAVSLRYEDGQFLFDAGEFTTELRPSLNSEIEDGEGFVTFGAPLPGLPIIFREVDGANVMVVGQGVTEYTFARE